MQKHTKMNWQKKGLLIKPDPSLYWMSTYVGPSFLHFLKNDNFVIYLTGRDNKNTSRIGRAYGIFLDGKLIIKKIEKKVIFDVGEPGCFDENGVSYPWLIFKKNKIFMYYVGWVSGGITRFQNYTGLAISKNKNKFYRYSNVPILDRNSSEPFGSGSCSVIKNKNGYEMLYTSFVSWIKSKKRDRSYDPRYNLKYATSPDGLNWKRKNIISIKCKNNETVIGKPSILKSNGNFKVWFSFRGNSYRIGFAEGKSLTKLTRNDKLANINISKNGWDSEMIEYAHVVEHKNYQIMIYNGNEFGKTGLGYAMRMIND